MSTEQQPRHVLVVLTDGVLTRLAASDSFITEFPFLSALTKLTRTGGCGACGRRNSANAEAYNAVKRNIAGLASDRKQKLKHMLSAKAVRVIYRADDGKVIQLTF